MITVEIDKDSGFCFGVTTAIGKAEEELRKGGVLYCLGDIVHNDVECDRLQALGLKTIDRGQFNDLRKSRVLLRAHGEPPLTYQIAQKNGIELIDATCPVVLKLQQRIKNQFTRLTPGQQIVIFGQKGHAEVLGLVGQTDGEAIVVESSADLDKIDFTRDVFLYAQTTKSSSDYSEIIESISSRLKKGARLTHFNTICGQVSHRRENIRNFAAGHDVVLFVAGQKSSNGKVLLSECRQVNPRTHSIEGPDDMDHKWFKDARSVGICGATSTPKWLMEKCRQEIFDKLRN